MPGRNFVGGGVTDYRYGYQGSEKNSEVGVGIYTTFFRELDSRIARWWSIDPKSKADESPYVSMGNKPIWHNDVLGDTDDKERKSNPKSRTNSKSNTANPNSSNTNTTKGSSVNSALNSLPNGTDDAVEGVTEGFLKDAGAGAAKKLAKPKLVYYFAATEKVINVRNVPEVLPAGTEKVPYASDLNGLGGGKAGFYVTKVPSKPVLALTKTAVAAGTALGIAAYGNDIYNYSNDQLSGQRFAFKTTGFATATAVGALDGGPWGAAAGLAFSSAEAMYDLGTWFKGEVSRWNAHTENALQSGWTPSNPMQIFSDSTLKKDITAIDVDSISSKLNRLNIYSYIYISDSAYNHNVKDLGLLAQDLEKLFPNCVYTNSSGIKTIDYARLIPILIADSRKKDNDIEELKKMVNQLQNLFLQQQILVEKSKK